MLERKVAEKALPFTGTPRTIAVKLPLVQLFFSGGGCEESTL
jgi:hypothetical protein